MDTSKKYILMCKNAIEIQKYVFPIDKKPVLQQGDFYKMNDKILISPNHIIRILGTHIWLPRQDQLQDMIESKGWFRKIVKLYDYSFSTSQTCHTSCLNEELIKKEFADGMNFYENCIDDIQNKWASMEQLWLSFVMKEKFNKIWDQNVWKSGRA